MFKEAKPRVVLNFMVEGRKARIVGKAAGSFAQYRVETMTGKNEMEEKYWERSSYPQGKIIYALCKHLEETNPPRDCGNRSHGPGCFCDSGHGLVDPETDCL